MRAIRGLLWSIESEAEALGALAEPVNATLAKGVALSRARREAGEVADVDADPDEAEAPDGAADEGEEPGEEG